MTDIEKQLYEALNDALLFIGLNTTNRDWWYDNVIEKSEAAMSAARENETEHKQA